MNENDFKYVIRQTGQTAIGARYSYSELMADTAVPFKLQTIIDRLVLPLVPPELTLTEHMLSMTEEDKNFRIYEALRLKVRYFVPKEKGGYKERVTALKEFIKVRDSLGEGIMIQEIMISDLALWAFRM